MSAVGRYLLVVLALCVSESGRAEDLERGKSGPAIFAADCSGCHRSAQGLAYGMSGTQLMDLLRQHYTTGPGPANQVATYLLSVVGTGRRPKEKPLTEPRPAAASPASEQAGKRRPGEESAVDPVAGQRPPAEIGTNGPAVGEPGGAASDRSRSGPAAKRRQQADHPAEPASQNRPKKLGQPAAGTRGPEAEPARPPQPISAQPSDSVAVRPPEPAGPPLPSAEAKPAETAPRSDDAKPEATETSQTHAAAPSGASAKPRQEPGDQPAFSAPSP